MGAQLIEEAECVELADRMGEQIDADAEGTQLAGRIEHVHLHADFVQAEGGRQASDAGADDQCRADRTGPGSQDLVHVDADGGALPVAGRDGDEIVQPAQAGRRSGEPDQRPEIVLVRPDLITLQSTAR